MYVLVLTLILAVLGGSDRAAPPPASTLSTGAQLRISAPVEPPCPGWGTSLAARDLSGRCRAYPQPTPGALEAIADESALKKSQAPAQPALPEEVK